MSIENWLRKRFRFGDHIASYVLMQRSAILATCNVYSSGCRSVQQRRDAYGRRWFL